MTSALALAVTIVSAAAARGTGPDDDPAGLAKLLRRADAAFAAGAWDRAREDYEAALERRPGSPTLHLQIARCDHARGRHADEIPHLEAILAADPGHPEAGTRLAREQIAAGRVEQGLARLRALPPAALEDAAVCYEIGARLLDQRRHRDAAEWFSRALRLRPDLAAAHLYRGLARLVLGDEAGARHDFERTLELDPDEATARSAREALARLGG